MKKFRFPSKEERTLKSLKDKISHRLSLYANSAINQILKVKKGDVIYILHYQDRYASGTPTMHKVEVLEDYDVHNRTSWANGTSFKTVDGDIIKIGNCYDSNVSMFLCYNDCKNCFDNKIKYSIAKLELEKYKKQLEINSIEDKQSDLLFKSINADKTFFEV